MCILCVIQKWSRRVATMLPWLVIPLIGLWALSQLLPPAFRFEITSPRLACVLVLLVTLFWYEVLMPQLSAWRVRRNARLRERKRFEAIELQKLRKTATRRCRNCLTPYRDQNPGAGRFMCSYCGHISKRPVLDLPIPPGLGLSNSGILKDLVGRTGKILNGKMWADNSGMCGQDWVENGNWVAGKSNYSRGGFFGGDDHCMTEKSYSCVVMFACKILMAFLLSIGWLWRKITRVTSSGDDSSFDAELKGMLDKRCENGVNYESRGVKARRKAEEKRQARIERELLEEEERKQREEVARLVEERRRLRDEKEAEKDRGKGSATARENGSKREAERKRQERRKEKDRGSSKSNSDVEELDKRVGKENDRKRDFDRKTEADKREHLKAGGETAKGNSMETGYGFKGSTVNNPGRGNTGSRYLDRVRGTFLSSSRAFSGGSFFGRGASTATISRENKHAGSIDHIQNHVQGRMLSQTERVNEKSPINGDDRNITHPVLADPQPVTLPKNSWQQLFTRSSAVSPPSNSSVISRPNGKSQAEAHSPPFSGQSSSSIQLYDNPISFGLPSPFTLPTSPYGSTGSSAGFSFASDGSNTLLPLASEAMYPRFGEAPCEFLPEESDIFEDPCYVPDPISLLGPVSESLDNFQLDLGVGFKDLGLEKPRALNNISASSEVKRPSPIESPMSRSRVADERYASSNRFSTAPKAQEGFTSPTECTSNANENGTWQMWNSSPLGQNGLGLLGDPGSWLLPAELNGSRKEDVDHPTARKTMVSLFTEDEKSLSGTYSPQNVFLGNGQNCGTFGPSLLSSGDDPWLQKTLFGASENHFPLNSSKEISHQNEMIYGSPNGSASNPPFELSSANCWANRKDWNVQSSGEGTGNSSTSRPHVGGLYSTPDVQSLWSV